MNRSNEQLKTYEALSDVITLKVGGNNNNWVANFAMDNSPSLSAYGKDKFWLCDYSKGSKQSRDLIYKVLSQVRTEKSTVTACL